MDSQYGLQKEALSTLKVSLYRFLPYLFLSFVASFVVVKPRTTVVLTSSVVLPSSSGTSFLKAEIFRNCCSHLFYDTAIVFHYSLCRITFLALLKSKYSYQLNMFAFFCSIRCAGRAKYNCCSNIICGGVFLFKYVFV